MKRSKFFIIALSFLISMVMVLSACGGGTESSAPTGNQTNETADSGGSAEAETTTETESGAADTVTAEPDKGPYWLTDEKVTYSFLLPTITDLNQFPFYQHLEEITNIHINYITLSGDDLTSYVNLMWASGDLPDLIRGITAMDFATYADQGQFFPINTLWEENMPNFMKVIDQFPEIENRLQMPDGNVYSLTGISSNTIQATSGVWVYQPWLDTLGISPPTTTEGFYDMLTAFKESDPNGNGVQDEIPFAFAWASWRHGQVHGWFGCSQDFLIQDGVVSYSPYTENWRTYVKFMNRLWNSGLLDPEVFTQDSATFAAKSTQDPVIHGAILDYGLYIPVTTNEYENYTLLGPMESGTTPSGVLNSRWDTEYQLWGIVAMNAKAQNPDLLLRWCDVFYDPYYGAQAIFGMDGMHIELNADGVFEYAKDVPAPYQNREEWFMATHYNQVLDLSISALTDLLVEENRNHVEMREIYQKFNDKFINEPLPAMTLQTWQEAEKLASYPDITMLRDSMTPQWIAGERDVDADWDNYIAQLEQLGVKEYIEAYQEFYSRIARQLGW